MSSRYQLTAQEIADFEAAHSQTLDKRYADRLKTIKILALTNTSHSDEFVCNRLLLQLDPMMHC